MSAGRPGGGFGTVFHPEPDPGPPANGGPLRIGQLRPLPRRRRPAMILLAAVLIGVGILGGAALFKNVNHQVDVLMVNQAVPVGALVTSADLTTTSVAAAPAIQLVPVRQESQVVGLVAATNLQPGMLLTASDVTNSLSPATGQALVPVAVKPAALPVSGLAAGDRLLVVWAPGAQSSGSGSSAAGVVPARAIAGVVEAVSSAPDQDGFDVVDVLVPLGSATALARETATGDIALIITHRTP